MRKVHPYLYFFAGLNTNFTYTARDIRLGMVSMFVKLILLGLASWVSYVSITDSLALKLPFGVYPTFIQLAELVIASVELVVVIVFGSLLLVIGSQYWLPKLGAELFALACSIGSGTLRTLVLRGVPDDEYVTIREKEKT